MSQKLILKQSLEKEEKQKRFQKNISCMRNQKPCRKLNFLLKNKKWIASVCSSSPYNRFSFPCTNICISPDAVYRIETDVSALSTAPMPSGLYTFLKFLALSPPIHSTFLLHSATTTIYDLSKPSIVIQKFVWKTYSTLVFHDSTVYDRFLLKYINFYLQWQYHCKDLQHGII